MIEYRSFRNPDPPALVEIWNGALGGRGAVQLAATLPLEYFVLAKPYFDPPGLIVATEEGRAVGFVHAGFGPNETGSALSTEVGVTCAVAVRPTHRRRGIGSALLRRAEDYLTGRGARRVLAGAHRPLSPFYLGLYGGSDLPGFLASDPAAEPFLRKNQYTLAATTRILHRRLDQPLAVADVRFANLRKRFDVQLAPYSGRRSWWREGVLGPIETVEFRLLDKTTNAVTARAEVWEMEGFRWRWNEPAVGLRSLSVDEGQRRQGQAKFLAAQMLRHLQEQYFQIVEVQIDATDEAASKLFAGLGFAQVDVGQTFARE